MPARTVHTASWLPPARWCALGLVGCAAFAACSSGSEMRSHLCGADAATSGICDDGGYVAQIKEWFDDPARNGPSSGTQPFDLPLEPSTDRYCE